MSAPDLDMTELASLRKAAAALAGQDGRGVPRSALVAVAETSARYALSVYAGNPPLAVAHSLPARAAFAELTPREREVAALIAEGHGNKEIAAALVISLGTVKDHVHHILEKTKLSSRAAVAAAWHRPPR
jgi:DNA-binding NarL/FixJ family response regulator